MSSNMTPEQKAKAEWSWRIIMSVIGGATLLLVGTIGWFARDAYMKQAQFNLDVDTRVRDLEVYRASSEASRFTATEWVNAKGVLDERDVNLDKRVTRIEDAIPAIKVMLEKQQAYLERIETKIEARARRQADSPP